jgi:hypothetical protein
VALPFLSSPLRAHVADCRRRGIRTTCQFNSKIFYLDGSKPPLWCSTPLKNHDFSEDKNSFYATDCAVELSEDGTSYTIKSVNDERAIVNVKITRTVPGFHAGKTGNSYFGTDPANPWGRMRHAFWPRCTAEGTIATKDGTVDFKGKAMFIHALQGMKPHHAAARWNFVDFQGPTYSAVLMEYTTPPSYGSTVVGVGAVVKDGEIIIAGTDCKVTHLDTKKDSDNDWPEPTIVKVTWTGTAKDGKQVEGLIEGDYEERLDRIDVMEEVPGFVKKIVQSAAGTKPYIYQVSTIDQLFDSASGVLTCLHSISLASPRPCSSSRLAMRRSRKRAPCLLRQSSSQNRDSGATYAMISCLLYAMACPYSLSIILCNIRCSAKRSLALFMTRICSPGDMRHVGSGSFPYGPSPEEGGREAVMHSLPTSQARWPFWMREICSGIVSAKSACLNVTHPRTCVLPLM